MEASLCLEAAERPQWPRVYSLDRPRSRGHMPSLVGDSGQVLGVQGWDSTRMHNLPLVLQCLRQDISAVGVGGRAELQSHSQARLMFVNCSQNGQLGLVPTEFPTSKFL